MKTFNLPDLGEGLPDAEIVRWLVKEGDKLALDQPMVEMETAKAVVEVPSPFEATVTRLCGQAGEIIEVGSVLVEFDGEPDSQKESLEQSVSHSAKSELADAGAMGSEQPHSATQDKNTFYLPDLGEGLPDAEIVRWLVKEGDTLTLDQPMVEMETAKAVVEVPSPFTSQVSQLHGKEGDVIEVGAPLVSFGILSKEAAGSQVSSGEPMMEEKLKELNDTETSNEAEKAATVVGAMQVGNSIGAESANVVVKALARKLKVDLAQVRATGKNGDITQADVKRAKAEGKLLSRVKPPANASEGMSAYQDNPLAYKASPAVRAHAHRAGISLGQCIATGSKGSITRADVDAVSQSAQGGRVAGNKETKKITKSFSTVQASDTPLKVRGVRRAMAMGMSKAHTTVVPTTLMEDADITNWPKQDALARYVRALVYAAKFEPALNCWFDGEKFERLVHPQVNVGLAVDSADGLYVPVIHNADQMSAVQVRSRVEQLREKIESKSLSQADQQGGTITLSNFGSIAGRYGTPVVSPPQVAILGTGRFRDELKLTEQGISKRKMLPLSLTFDHRACTGGEAARFLAAVIEDLQKPV